MLEATAIPQLLTSRAVRTTEAAGVATDPGRGSDAVVELERANEELQRRCAALESASDANDPTSWAQARAELDLAVAHADAVRAQTHALGRRADNDDPRLRAALHSLAVLEARAGLHRVPPSGFSAIAAESEIASELATPVQGGAAAGYARKELALRNLIANLSPADCRTLAARLRRADPRDAIAHAFVRFSTERRQRLLAFLDDSPRRAAVQREPVLRAKTASEATSTSTSTSTSTTRLAPAVTASPATATYDDLLAAVIAAQELTDRDQRDAAQHVLEPVETRLLGLEDAAYRKLSHFGAGNIAGHAMFDTAKSAVSSWIRKLKLGASIATEPYVTRFRAGAQAIRLAMGERDGAPELVAFDHATRLVGLGAAALVAGPPVAALAVEQAGLAAALGRVGARDVALWALHHPAAAIAIAEVMTGVGLQLADDGVDGMADRVRSPLGCLFALMQIAMDAMHIAGAFGGSPPSRGGPPGPRLRPSLLPGDGSLDDTPPIARQTATQQVTSTTPAPAAEPHGSPSHRDIPVQLTDVYVDERNGDMIWGIAVKARLPNALPHCLGTGSIILTERPPTAGPTLIIGKVTNQLGYTGRVQLYDGTKRLSVTDVVLDHVIERFRNRFGFDPPSLPGQLVDDNKLHFQRALVDALEAGHTRAEAEQIAARATSFGRSRIERGYDDLRVRTNSDEYTDLGKRWGLQNVPYEVNIVARKKQP